MLNFQTVVRGMPVEFKKALEAICSRRFKKSRLVIFRQLSEKMSHLEQLAHSLSWFTNEKEKSHYRQVKKTRQNKMLKFKEAIEH